MMKKNYSEINIQIRNIHSPNSSNLSQQKQKSGNSLPKKAFKRKPAGGYLPFTKKKTQKTIQHIQQTKQPHFCELFQKSKELRFITCHSQSSLNCSVISQSSEEISFVDSTKSTKEFNKQELCYSKFLPGQNTIGQNYCSVNSQRQLFRRKNIQNTRMQINSKKRLNLEMSHAVIKITRKQDSAEIQTKMQSCQYSDHSKTFCSPILNKKGQNLVGNSKNSSKESLRKSNSSNSLLKKQSTQNCRQCEFQEREIRQLLNKNDKLERIIHHKDEQICYLNKKLKQSEKRTIELQRKVREIEKSNQNNTIQLLEQQLNQSHQQCSKVKQLYNKTLQELKYKNVENCTLKRYQSQCQAQQSKILLLVTERNELKERLQNMRKSSRTNFLNYPSKVAITSPKSKAPVNLVFPRNTSGDKEKRKQQYTERDLTKKNNEIQDLDEDYHNYINKNKSFSKKKSPVKHYDEGEESEIISLSEESMM